MEPDHGAMLLVIELGALSEPEHCPATARPVLIKLRLPDGLCLRFDSNLDDEALTRLFRAMKAV